MPLLFGLEEIHLKPIRRIIAILIRKSCLYSTINVTKISWILWKIFCVAAPPSSQDAFDPFKINSFPIIINKFVSNKIIAKTRCRSHARVSSSLSLFARSCAQEKEQPSNINLTVACQGAQLRDVALDHRLAYPGGFNRRSFWSAFCYHRKRECPREAREVASCKI